MSIVDFFQPKKKKRKLYGKVEPLKFMTWNTNSILLRAKRNTGEIKSFVEEHSPDVICIQETRALKSDQREVERILKYKGGLQDYAFIWKSHPKKRYSGVCIIHKYDCGIIGDPVFNMDVENLDLNDYEDASKNPDKEARIIQIEFENFFVVNTYVPNCQWYEPGRIRRQTWDTRLTEHLKQLRLKKPLIWIGDLNVCHKNSDVSHPDYFAKAMKWQDKTNSCVGQPGFTQQEKESFTNMLTTLELLDSFRHCHPHLLKFSWGFPKSGIFSDKGMRLDYFCVDKRMTHRIKSSDIYKKMGSDHRACLMELFDESVKSGEKKEDDDDLLDLLM